MDLWRHRLEDEPFVTYPQQCVGLCIEGSGGPRLGKSMLGIYSLIINLTSTLPAHLGQMLYAGTYSKCLGKWEKPIGDN
jgi:hypothetical protein